MREDFDKNGFIIVRYSSVILLNFFACSILIFYTSATFTATETEKLNRAVSESAEFWGAEFAVKDLENRSFMQSQWS